MRNLIIILLFMAPVVLTAQSKDNFIYLRTGEQIRCSFIELDSINNQLNFKAARSNVLRSVAMSEVGSYIINGVVNAGIKSIVLPPSKAPAFKPLSASCSEAGQQLIKFADNAQAGIGLLIAGSIITLSSALVVKSDYSTNLSGAEKDQKISRTLLATGSAVSALGFIIHLSSYSNARKAGQILLNSTQDGVGVAIPIK